MTWDPTRDLIACPNYRPKFAGWVRLIPSKNWVGLQVDVNSTWPDPISILRKNNKWLCLNIRFRRSHVFSFPLKKEFWVEFHHFHFIFIFIFWKISLSLSLSQIFYSTICMKRFRYNMNYALMHNSCVFHFLLVLTLLVGFLNLCAYLLRKDGFKVSAFYSFFGFFFFFFWILLLSLFFFFLRVSTCIVCF